MSGTWSKFPVLDFSHSWLGICKQLWSETTAVWELPLPGPVCACVSPEPALKVQLTSPSRNSRTNSYVSLTWSFRSARILNTSACSGDTKDEISRPLTLCLPVGLTNRNCRHKNRKEEGSEFRLFIYSLVLLLFPLGVKMSPKWKKTVLLQSCHFSKTQA